MRWRLKWRGEKNKRLTFVVRRLLPERKFRATAGRRA
jgi:hypothetical protein